MKGGYPANWAEIARGVKERAGWRCEHCGAKHGAWGSHDRTGRFHEADRREMRRLGHGKPPFRLRLSRGGFAKVVEVQVQAAHLDQHPPNCDPTNLRCLCRYCHLAYDVEQHVRNAASTRRRKMKTGELFAGPPTLPKDQDRLRLRTHPELNCANEITAAEFDNLPVTH